MPDIGLSLNANPDDLSQYPSAGAIGNPPISITRAMADYVNRPRPAPNSLSMLMDHQQAADAGIPVTVKDDAALMRPPLQPSFDALAAKDRASRPELQAMARDPGIAKAMDDAFAATRHGGSKQYDGEHGFYVMEDSSGQQFAQPYGMTLRKGQGWIGAEINSPDHNPLNILKNAFLNRKPVALFHAHPNGVGWQQGPSQEDLDAGNKYGVPVIVKAPDGMHYGGVRAPDRPQPYHGLFNWLGK